jgi:hypothetical protein
VEWSAAHQGLSVIGTAADGKAERVPVRYYRKQFTKDTIKPGIGYALKHWCKSTAFLAQSISYGAGGQALQTMAKKDSAR